MQWRTRSASSSRARWPPPTSRPPARHLRASNAGWRSRPMLKQTEGSRAVAEAVALCRPEVICAYPLSPQTHIVDGLGERVKSGALAPCEFIIVERAIAAMRAAIGSTAAGARTYKIGKAPCSDRELQSR